MSTLFNVSDKIKATFTQFLLVDRFVLLVDSEESGVTNSDQFEITGASVSTGTTFPVRFSPEANRFDFTDVTVDVSNPVITFPTAGRYFVQIGKPFQRIQFSNAGDKDKLIEIVQWGDLAWSSFGNAFNGCNLTSLPSPMTGDFSELTNFFGCFSNNELTSIPAGLFDNTTAVTNFSACFSNNQLSSIPKGLFDNTTQVTLFLNCFEGNTLDTPDLSRLYCELSVFNENTNVPFHGGEGNYDPALNFVVDGNTINTGDARDVLAIDRSWTLTDGGAV